MNLVANGKVGQSRRKWIEGLWQWIGISLGVALLYVLSVGPAIRLAEEGWLSKASISKMYRPLGLIRGTPLEKLLNIYVRFWLPPPKLIDSH